MEDFRKWECIVCGWIYDEAEGLPEEGIPPGTKWEDVPHDGFVQTVAWERRILT